MRYHITWDAYGSWLPGDSREFRARHGRQHVDGDYKNPPPPGKYKALHAHARRSLKKPPAEIPPDLREVIALPCLQQFADEEVEVFAISVDSWHVHAAVDCPPDGLKQMIGCVKKVSSHLVQDRISGRLWQAGCRPVRVWDKQHRHNVLAYIRSHAQEAWVWCR